MMKVELSAPHNWCDRRCERCPLARECPIPAAAERPLGESLREAAAMLEAICEEEGISIEALEEVEIPVSIDEAVLRAAGWDWAMALAELEEVVDDVPCRMALVAGKVARIAGRDEDDDDDGWVWAADTVPNLLLLERVMDAVRADVEQAAARASTARFEESDRVLRGLLAPLFRAVTAQDRAVFAALARAGRAPSPFAVR